MLREDEGKERQNRLECIQKKADRNYINLLTFIFFFFLFPLLLSSIYTQNTKGRFKSNLLLRQVRQHALTSCNLILFANRAKDLECFSLEELGGRKTGGRKAIKCIVMQAIDRALFKKSFNMSINSPDLTTCQKIGCTGI